MLEHPRSRTACPSCKTRYRIDPTRLAGSQANLRCSQCGTVFRVRVGAVSRETAAPWVVVREGSGEEIAASSLASVQRLIIEGRVGGADTLTRAGEEPRTLRDIPQFQPFLRVGERSGAFRAAEGDKADGGLAQSTPRDGASKEAAPAPATKEAEGGDVEVEETPSADGENTAGEEPAGGAEDEVEAEPASLPDPTEAEPREAGSGDAAASEEAAAQAGDATPVKPTGELAAPPRSGPGIALVLVVLAVVIAVVAVLFLSF